MQNVVASLKQQQTKTIHIADCEAKTARAKQRLTELESVKNKVGVGVGVRARATVR